MSVQSINKYISHSIRRFKIIFVYSREKQLRVLYMSRKHLHYYIQCLFLHVIACLFTFQDCSQLC